MLLWAAWHGAYLERVKDFPPLDRIMPKRPKTAAETAAEKRALAENLKAALMRVKPTGRGEPPRPDGNTGNTGAVAAE